MLFGILAIIGVLAGWPIWLVILFIVLETL